MCYIARYSFELQINEKKVKETRKLMKKWRKEGKKG